MSLFNVTVTGNIALIECGGILCETFRSDSCSLSLENVTVSNNISTFLPFLGSGIECFAKDSSICIVSLKNVTVSNNSGRGIYTDSKGGTCNLSLMNVTVSGNNLVGISCVATNASLVNTIIWNNYSSGIDFYNSQGSIAYSDIQGGEAGISKNDATLNWLEGNIDTYPLFVDTSNADYHLSDNSPCIGAGIDSIEINGEWYYAPNTDCEGKPRPNPFGSRPDIGAYESELGIPTYIEKETEQLPTEFILYQNYPNPFNPSTTIKFTLPKTEEVKIEVFNALGQKVVVLINKTMPAGSNEVEFNAQYLPSGLYVYKIEAGHFKDVKKMLFLK